MALSKAEQEKRRTQRNTLSFTDKNRPPDQFNANLVPPSRTKELEGLMLIPLDDLVTFQGKDDGDFTPLNDEELQQMAETMDDYGPNEPIIVRQLQNMKYEILSGEQRFRASKLRGNSVIRAFVQRNCSDKKAKEIFLIQNLTRRKDRVSDKIYGWTQFWRLNDGHLKEALENVNVKDSYSQVSVYVKCSSLNKNIVSCMDSSKMSLRAGYQLSFLTSSEQDLLSPYLTKITESFAKEIREASEKNALNQEWLKSFFNDETPTETIDNPDLIPVRAHTRMPPHTEQAKKEITVHNKLIRKGMRTLRNEVINLISPNYYDAITDIVSDALEQYLDSHEEYKISEEERNYLAQLKDNANIEFSETETQDPPEEES